MPHNLHARFYILNTDILPVRCVPKPKFKQNNAKLLLKNVHFICTRSDVHDQKPSRTWVSNTYCRTRVKASWSTFILVELGARTTSRTGSGVTHEVAQNKPARDFIFIFSGHTCKCHTR